MGKKQRLPPVIRLEITEFQVAFAPIWWRMLATLPNFTHGNYHSSLI
jgi:hypothetical protein